MDTKDIHTLRDFLHELPSNELLIVSLFLLPILFLIWLGILDSFGATLLWKIGIVVVLLVLYIFGLILWKRWDPPEEKLKRARRHIKNRLERRKGYRASFEAIREEVDMKYSDEFLRKLIEQNPGTFRTVKIKKAEGSVPGITLVEEEVENR